MQEQGLIDIDESNFNRIIWTGTLDETEHRYKDVERLIRTGALSYVNDTFLVWSFPVEALEAFDEVIILTYRFRNSIFQGYLDFWGKEYEHQTLIREGTGFRLERFSPKIEQGNEYYELINICQVPKLNAIGVKIRRQFPLSVSWYNKKNNKEKQKVLRDHVTNYLRHYCKAKRDSVMWTTFKGNEKRIQPKGYTKRTDGTPSFVPCNCRATEEFKETYNLVYTVDRHIHPGIVHFFAQKGISIDNNEYALSELIQWLFRSRVRKKEPVNIYIPSERMRNLLVQ